MWSPFRRKQGDEKALQQPASRGGWSPLYSSIHEPFAEAWRHNLEISQDTILSYYTVFTCISLIASDIAKMPPQLMRRDLKGVMQEVGPGDIPALYKRPNTFQNRIQFFENWLNSKLCHGNMVALKVRNNAGKITELRLLDQRKVAPLVTDDGSVFYQINSGNMTGIESSVTVPAREVIHDRFNYLFHPLIGLSPIYAAGLTAMQGHHIQENSAFFFRNGEKPSDVIEVPGSLTEENARTIRENWDSGYSGKNVGKTAILSNKAKYNPTTVFTADTQAAEQLSMTAQIICSVFHIPAYKVGVGELPTHDNIEAQDQRYYSQCLQSLIESVELLLDEAFDLDGETGTEFDVNALLRVDSERRIKSLGEDVKSTILTPSETRRSENLPPLPGGDTLYLQQQNCSLGAPAWRDASDGLSAKSGASSVTAPEESGGKVMSESELTAVRAMLRGLLTK